MRIENKDYTLDPVVKLRNLSNMSSDISGQTYKYKQKDLQEQVKIIQSEVDELAEGVDTGDPKETIDGAVDALVTIFGMLRRLEAAGYDVNRAMDKVGMNNLTKFPTSLTVVDASVKMFAEKGVKITPVFSHNFDRWALIDENGKFRKPIDYKDVDLSDCTPK